MFPFVPSNSLLHVAPPELASIGPGDVVCYPGAGQVIAHRVQRVAHGPRGPCFITRGDAMLAEEHVEAGAIAYVVRRVEHRFFEYDVDGWVGRRLAACAVHRGVGFRVLLGLGVAMARVLRAGRALGGLCGCQMTSPPGPGLRTAALASVPPAPAERRVLLIESSPGELSSPSGLELGSESAPSSPVAGRWGSSDSLLRLLNHELRTPLNGILGFLEVLLGELDGPLVDDERENLGFVRDAGQQLLSLVGELLDLVAAVASDAGPELERVDLGPLLEDERALLEERRGLRPVHVRVEIAPEAASIVTDRAQLSRVLRVLGELAIDVTVSGEVALEAVATGELDAPVCLRVRADGPLWKERAVSGEQPSSPGSRDDRLRQLRLQMVEVLVGRALGRFEPSTHESGSQLALFLAAERLTPQLAPQSQGDIPLAVRYLAASGHDLRTPLNAILGFSDLVAMRDHARWTQSQHKSLTIVRERARDLASMVDDMIDWAKLELGDLRLAPGPHGARALIDRAAAAAIEHSGSRGLQVDVTCAGELGQILVDGERFVQALLGLLENAARATPAPRVQLRAERTPDGMRIQVVDPALEVRLEDRAHIFAAFRPSFAPTGQRIAGLHLGTSVARALLRAHGGDVWFESRPGQGTTFVATLPEPCLA